MNGDPLGKDHRGEGRFPARRWRTCEGLSKKRRAKTASDVQDNHGASVKPSVVLLFGAGASHLDGGNDRPPLTSGLFVPLQKRFPDTWGKISSDKADAFARNFEKEMDKAAHGSPLLAEMTTDMALYFSGFRPRQSEDDPYCRLIKGRRRLIRSRRLVVATLNYDCLIERAAEQAGFPFPPYYFKPGDGLRLLKLHGSCNFIVNQGNITIENKLTMAQNSKYESTVEPCHPDDVPKLLERRRFPPAMALITPEKEILSCRRQIDQIQDTYAKEVSRTDRIAVVGVKLARPNVDQQVWGPLIQSRAKIVFVGNEMSCKELADMRPGVETKWLGRRLESSMEKLERFFSI